MEENEGEKGREGGGAILAGTKSFVFVADWRIEQMGYWSIGNDIAMHLICIMYNVYMCIIIITIIIFYIIMIIMYIYTTYTKNIIYDRYAIVHYPYEHNDERKTAGADTHRDRE